MNVIPTLKCASNIAILSITPLTSMSTSTTTTTESRAITLLGNGIPPSAVASALGVDPSRITQLLSDETFAAKVIEAKFNNLSSHVTRDIEVDKLEDLLLSRLRDTVPYMSRPMELLKAFAVLNAAKRRTGNSVAQALPPPQTIIQLNIPSIILQKFSTNIHGQVTSVGNQSLVTIQSSQMLKTQEALNVSNGTSPIPGTAETKTIRLEPPASTTNVAQAA